MENNHKLALYVSYYLARFNNEALKNLGYRTWNNAFDDIAEKLQVNGHSVKNWRDEFDPLFGHRAGWYQRAMIPSRVRIVQALENLDEYQIRELVKDIISGKIKNEPDQEEQLTSIVSDVRDKNSNKKFILRGPTGKAAENFFVQYYASTKKPVQGELIDCRDLGCGYDFIIKSKDEYYIEVKGLAEIAGGILFTDKEWRIAKEKNSLYFLCLVSNIGDVPSVKFIENPAKKLIPKKNICTTIQINWSVSENELSKIQ